MVESIKSSEMFGNASIGQPVAPKHTQEGHESCAYYITEDNDGYIRCPHDEKALGAFYSEDHVKQLVSLGQEFLNEVDGLLRGHPNPSILLASINLFRERFK